MQFESRVIAGKGRGKGLGFPTLNLEIPPNFDSKDGIYACEVKFAEKTYIGAMHFGPVPVFNDERKSLEIFVLDWDAKTQPDAVIFEIRAYLRPIQNFASPQALADQISKDVEAIRAL